MQIICKVKKVHGTLNIPLEVVLLGFIKKHNAPKPQFDREAMYEKLTSYKN